MLSGPDAALYMDMKIYECKKDIIRILFPRSSETSKGQSGAVAAEANNPQRVLSTIGSDLKKSYELPQSNIELVSNQVPNTPQKNKVSLTNDCHGFWEIFDRIKTVNYEGDRRSFLLNDETIKVICSYFSSFSFSFSIQYLPC